MVTVISINNHRVALDELALVDGLRLLSFKGIDIVWILAFQQSHRLAILILEHKEMRCLLHNRIFHLIGTLENQRIADDSKTDRNAGCIRIEDTVAFGPESNILAIGIDPNTLQQSLSSLVLLLHNTFGLILLSLT